MISSFTVLFIIVAANRNEVADAFNVRGYPHPHHRSLGRYLYSTIESTTSDETAIDNNIDDTYWSESISSPMKDSGIDSYMESIGMRGRSSKQQQQSPRPIAQRTRYQALLALLAIITASDNGLEFQSMPVAETLLSLVVSIVIVSGFTDALERMTSQDVPLYSINGERYDQNTFIGRFCKMLLACDPRLLLYTELEIEQYRAMAYDGWEDILSQNGSSIETNRLLWESKRKADSALHTDTNEWIPRPFRMSGYLPFNGPICIAMVASTSTLPLLIWSFFNQSQNALINHFNGPKSVTDDANDQIDDGNQLMKSYSVAVISALSVAFGLSIYVQTNYSGEEATQLLRFVSFPSAVIASSLNCFIVRQPEIEAGVPLLNSKMENVLPGETSSLAAKSGVLFTTATRAVLQTPTYFIPPLLLETITPLKSFMAENPIMIVPITTFLLLISFGIGLPCTVGLFPQISRIKTEDVEKKYQGLGYDELYYNKGL